MKKSELMLLDAEWWLLPDEAVKDFDLNSEGYTFERVDAILYSWGCPRGANLVEHVFFSLLLWAMFESEGE